MNNSIFDSLIEKYRKMLRVLYPIYFTLILLLIGSIFLKNIKIIIIFGIFFILFSVFFFKFIIKMYSLNNRQIDYNKEIGKEKYKDLYK